MSYKSMISEIIKKLEKNETHVLEEIGELVTQETKRRCPELTGVLKNSYRYVVNSPGQSVRIGTGIFYGWFVEKGTSKMRAEPHFIPAVEQSKKKIEKVAAEAYGRGLS